MRSVSTQLQIASYILKIIVNRYVMLFDMFYKTNMIIMTSLNVAQLEVNGQKLSRCQ